MAARKPLVLSSNNEIEELSGSDTLDAVVVEVDVITRVNANAGSIVIGTPVYASAAGSVDKARANSGTTSKVLGLVKSASIATTASGSIQTNGTLTATTAEWDAVAGTTGGLTVGTEYILGPDTAGTLVARSTTIDAGEYVCVIGIALSTTELQIDIKERVKKN